MLKSIDLEKLENLASAATRGPWTYCSNEDQLGEYVCELTRGDGEKSDFSVGTRNDWGQMKNPEWNAMFIAAANPYVVLTLVAELKALRAAAAPAGDLNPVLDVMRNTGLSIDGDNAYKRDLLDCVVGALATGAQNSNPPPAGHWGQRFWDIGREERASSEQLLKALTALTQIAGECEQIASNYSGTIDGIFEHGGDDHEDPSCAIFHRLYYAMFDARAAIKKATI